jgi:hypothetical protein
MHMSGTWTMSERGHGTVGHVKVESRQDRDCRVS